MIAENVGMSNFIRAFRKDRGWTMEELAARVRPPTSAPTISKLEKGQIELTESWMRKLASAFECHWQDLLEGGPEALRRHQREFLNMIDLLPPEKHEVVMAFLQGLAAAEQKQPEDKEG